MRLLPALISTTLLFAPGIPSAAQSYYSLWNVREAPFTATWTVTKVEYKSGPTEAGTRTITVQGARDKNGSTYSAQIKDGDADQIVIVDVLKNRRIEIYPQDSTYFYTATLLNAEGKVPTCSMEESFKQLQNILLSDRRSPDRSGPTQRTHFIVLGCRQEDSLNLCGVRQENTLNTGEEQIFNTWWSDLGIMMRQTIKVDPVTPAVRDIQAYTST